MNRDGRRDFDFLHGHGHVRNDFRSFRPDRIAAFEASGETFADDAKRGLDAYLRNVGANPGAA